MGRALSSHPDAGRRAHAMSEVPGRPGTQTGSPLTHDRRVRPARHPGSGLGRRSLASGCPPGAVSAVRLEHDVERMKLSADGLHRLRPAPAINDLWYKNAVIYCLSVGTFMEANGDGIGDFAGLMRRLDYL